MIYIFLPIGQASRACGFGAVRNGLVEIVDALEIRESNAAQAQQGVLNLQHDS